MPSGVQSNVLHQLLLSGSHDRVGLVRCSCKHTCSVTAADLNVISDPAGNSPGSFAAAAGTAANFAVQQQQLAHLTLPTRTAAARSVPSKSVREQLQEAMQHLDMQDELQGDDDLLCVVCMHQERSQVLVPCGHMVLCSDCCAEILSKVGECPMCREKIVDHCTLQGMDLS